MNDTPLVAKRRSLLRAEVEAHGNAEIARAAGKPERQISDLVNGRASFGESIARQLEALRPDLPAGWLVMGTHQTAPHLVGSPVDAEYVAAAQAEFISRKALKSANEMLSLWMELPTERRKEVIASLREELGKNKKNQSDIGIDVVAAPKKRQKTTIINK